MLRGCAWMFCMVGLVLPMRAQGAPANPKSHQKLIVYPAEGETAEQLRAGGAKVDDYGSYWVVKANKSQADAVKKAYGARSQSANYLDRIELLAAQFDTSEAESAVPSQLRETGKSEKHLRLVQFSGPVQPGWLDMVKSAGRVKVISYVPNNAYIIWMDKASEDNIAQFLAPNGPVQWIGTYHPYYKIQTGLLPEHIGNPRSLIDVRVFIVDGPEADEALRAVKQIAFGGTKEPFVQLNHRIVQLTVRASEVTTLAQIPNVTWVERIVPRELRDEKQDLILASRTNQLPGHSPVPALLGGERYLEFLFDKVAGGAAGLGAFTNSANYPIVDIADTGLELGLLNTAHPAFYELGNPNLAPRVIYNSRAGYPSGAGCPRFSDSFLDGADFCGHGTFVASIVAGYDDGADQMTTCIQNFLNPQCVAITSSRVVCVVGTISLTNELTLIRKDIEGFQRGMGVSPFGLIGSTRIFSQDLTFQCNPYAITSITCDFCATSLQVLLTQEYLGRARIANNSWGDILVSTTNGIIVNAGLYTADSQTYDVGVRDALLTGTSTNVPGPSPLNQEMIAIFAGGNAGSVGNVGGFGDILVTAPATAKNIIAVGATENFRVTGDGCLIPSTERDSSFDVSGYSSFGPTLDGRFKPDILAPGSAIFGANNYLDFVESITDCTCTDGGINITCHPVEGVQSCLDLYGCGSGTSFSAPAVSGGAQLLWWYFQNRLNMLQPSPAMVKAYMLNSARYLPIENSITHTMDTLPSIAQGMGMMDLERMFDGVPRALRDQTTPRAIDVTLLLTNPVPQQTYFTRTGQSYELSGTIFDATKPFRVTLAWTDMAGDPVANGSLVNDLDLEVSVGGKTYRGNVFSGAHSVVDITRAVDNINNVESVFLPAGTTGTWSIVVRATNIAGDAVPNVGNSFDQDFALAIYNATAASDVPHQSTNDSCQTAALVTNFPYSAMLNLASPAFHNNHPSPSAAKGGIEAFWTVGRPSRGTVISVDTFNSNFDTVLSVWQGDCGSLVEVLSNNNASNTLQSALSFTADGTNTYFIVVDKRAGSGSSLKINIRAVPPPIALTPSPADFGSVLVGAESAPRTITYSNGSTQPVRIESMQFNGANYLEFTVFDDDCEDKTIPPGGTCTIRVVFVPMDVGLRTATLEVEDNQTGSPRIAILTGTGLPPSPEVCLTSSNLTFNTVAIGSTSTAQSVTFTNCGTADLFITNATVTGAASTDFLVTVDSCSNATVVPGGVCQVSIVFAPTAVGGRAATLRLVDDAETSPQLVLLSGTGKQPAPLVCLSTPAINFGNVEVDANSLIRSLIVTNCGTAVLNISDIALTGPGASHFSVISDACSGSPVALNGTCEIRLQFHPTGIGLFNATLNINDNASGNPHKVTLTGNGTGSQPDGLVSSRRRANTFVGDGIYNDTAEFQTASQKSNRGRRRVFYARVQNDGNAADSFRVQGSDDIPLGISVKYFLGAVRDRSCDGVPPNPPGPCDITAAVKAGTFVTGTLAPGATTSDATLIRIEITVDKLANAGLYDALVTFTSNSKPSQRDTVQASVAVP